MKSFRHVRINFEIRSDHLNIMQLKSFIKTEMKERRRRNDFF